MGLNLFDVTVFDGDICKRVVWDTVEGITEARKVYIALCGEYLKQSPQKRPLTAYENVRGLTHVYA